MFLPASTELLIATARKDKELLGAPPRYGEGRLVSLVRLFKNAQICKFHRGKGSRSRPRSEPIRRNAFGRTTVELGTPLRRPTGSSRYEK
jgi:hypothetical protein